MSSTVADYDDTCRSCGVPIIWAVHERTLKEAPIEARYRVLSVTDRFGKTGLHLNHFATCAQAPKWRQR